MRLKSVSLTVLLILFTTLACSLSNPGNPTPTPRTTIRETPSATPSLIETLEHEASTAVSVPPTAASTKRPIPTKPAATPTAEQVPPTIINQGFGQQEDEVGAAFIVHNPNDNWLYESIRYDIFLYDESGNQLASEGSYISQLLPNQELGVADTLSLPPGQTAANMLVKLETVRGKPASLTESQNPIGLTADGVIYYPGDYIPRVVGLIHSPFSRTLSFVRLSAVLFDESGQIIGGGLTFLDFIHPDTQAGVRIFVTGQDQVARAEIYPMLSSLTISGTSGDTTTKTADLRVTNFGFAQEDRTANFGIVFESGENTDALQNSKYIATFFAENGDVLNIQEGFLNTILPGQTLGVTSSVIFDTGQTAVRMDVQLLDGRRAALSEVDPPFTLTDPSYTPGSFADIVTVDVTNPHYQTITNLRLSVLALNQSGQIIGAGFTFFDYDTNGSQTAEIAIKTSETPAAFLIYGSPTSISEITLLSNE